MGFEKATPIQEKAIPAILDGKDLLACAQTGTGKTAAFILPVLDQLSERSSNKTRCVVIAPTRELVIQIDQQIQAFSYFAGVGTIPVYGGTSGKEFEAEKKALSHGADIVVATPGKLITHLNFKYTDFSQVEYLILDEADRMLDMGFHDDIMRIVRHMPKDRINLLFSATMPPKIRKLSKAMLKDPLEISIAISKPSKGILQASYLVKDEQKAKLIRKLINDKPAYKSIIVFSSTKKNVSTIVRAISKQGYDVAAVSSDLDQKERESALRKFKSKETRVIVATDVLSRGIDVADINLVINYDVPRDAEDYVHRIGRTARADTTGVAITLVNQDDMYKFAKIEKLIEQEVIKLKVPEEMGTSPEWNPRKPSGGRGGGYKGNRRNNSKNKNRR
jgi:superfamily II DNA/RNA helicase